MDKEVKDEKTYQQKVNDSIQKMMKEDFEKGQSIFQLPKEERQKMQTPVLFYRNKEGQLKTTPVPAGNYLPLLQYMHDHGYQDNRFMVKDAAFKTPDILVAKGTKTAPMTLFKKDKSEDKSAYTVQVVNFNDLSGKNVPKENISRPRGDVYLHDMVNYLAMRTERGTYKPDHYYMMYKDAQEAANKNYQIMKPRYAEHDKRMSAIKTVDVSKPAEKDDYKTTFLQMMKQELQGKEPKHFVVNAAKKALTELKWTENTVKAAIQSFAPASAYDGIGKRAPYNEYILDGIKKSKEYQASKQTQQAK